MDADKNRQIRMRRTTRRNRATLNSCLPDNPIWPICQLAFHTDNLIYIESCRKYLTTVQIQALEETRFSLEQANKTQRSLRNQNIIQRFGGVSYKQ